MLAIAAVGLTLLLSGCATTQNTNSTIGQEKDPYDGKRVRVIDNPLSLEDFLVRAPGVVVNGATVSIRGGGPPLFIVDDIPLGNSYAGAVNAVNPQDIASVEVISGPDAAIYGRRGANGVIVIRTKTY